MSDLNEQERVILRLAAGHLTNAEIGGRLSLSPKTIEWYMTHILQKLGVHDRHEASRIYLAEVRSTRARAKRAAPAKRSPRGSPSRKRRDGTP